MLAWAGESHYSTEPKRRAKLGYLSASKAPGKTRERTVYLRADIAELQQRRDDAERTATRLTHREKYLRLAVGFLRRLLDLHAGLIDDVEHELRTGQKSGRGSEELIRSMPLQPLPYA